MSDLLKINPKDNVSISLNGENGFKIGHKIALNDIKKGELVIKYGHTIGRAKVDIKKGEWVHSHNLESNLDQNVDYSYSPQINSLNKNEATFLGFKRKYGRAGIRNDIYIIPTVGCVNSVVKKLEQEANKLDKGSIDGIFALTHQFGCSQLGIDQENIAKLLASLALNPNASFVLFVGLGCENNSINEIKKYLSNYNNDNIYFMICQEHVDEIEYGLNIIKDLVNKAKVLKREKISVSDLCIGLKCGGSDAFSGLTANPTVGKVSDKIISCGGSAILTEVPEMFGAEQILMNKCADENVYTLYKKLILDFKNYYTSLGFPVYENPSPGNKEGGITTLEEKSLGCITKAGSSPIVDVLDYAETIRKTGLSVLNGPGNDMIAATALAAAGCQLILFTTGRGTPLSTVVPTIKIATNNTIAFKKCNWIDFNAFDMNDDALFKLVLDTASGKYKTKQEGSCEIAFFKKGVTL